MIFDLDFPRAYGTLELIADFRCEAADFRVTEALGFIPQGSGEHIYVSVRKTAQNTQWVAKQLARYAGVNPRDVGYSGLKDRHAITTQWFSIYDPKKTAIAWQNFTAAHPDNAGIEILEVSRHHKKLKPGTHLSNAFAISLKNLRGRSETPLSATELQTILTKKLADVARAVPNYFGEQRFGIDANNLQRVQEWLEQKNNAYLNTLPGKQRGLIISAARAFIFNQVLAARVNDGTWNVKDNGDHVTSGPLWGRGRSLVSGDDGELEARVLEPWTAWLDALEHVGLSQERRALVLQPTHFSAEISANALQLSFVLGPGQYATSVLREVAALVNRGGDESSN